MRSPLRRVTLAAILLLVAGCRHDLTRSIYDGGGTDQPAAAEDLPLGDDRDLPWMPEVPPWDRVFALDHGPKPEGPAADLEMGISSSYGEPCVPGRGINPDLCPDQVTFCVPLGTGGFCTHACDPRGTSCPPGPPQAAAWCELEHGSKKYCLFYCFNGGIFYKCPPNLTCQSGSSYRCYP